MRPGAARGQLPAPCRPPRLARLFRHQQAGTPQVETLFLWYVVNPHRHPAHLGVQLLHGEQEGNALAAGQLHGHGGGVDAVLRLQLHVAAAVDLEGASDLRSSGGRQSGRLNTSQARSRAERGTPASRLSQHTPRVCLEWAALRCLANHSSIPFPLTRYSPTPAPGSRSGGSSAWWAQSWTRRP